MEEPKLFLLRYRTIRMRRNKPPKIAEWIISLLTRRGNRQTLIGDLEEEYTLICTEDGKVRADAWYFTQIGRPFISFIRNRVLWSTVMLKSYIKIAWRNLIKFRKYSFINIMGLGLGLACCIVILMYVQLELSYDNYHEDLDRIYRIPMHKESSSRQISWAMNTAPLAPTLKALFPQVEKAGRLYFMNDVPIKVNGETRFEDDVAMVDQEIFDILTVSFLHGDPASALSRPNTAVLTREMALRYFGIEDVIGKTIQVGSEDIEITGIIQDSPRNTHMKFKILGALFFEEDPWWMNHWPTVTTYTYVKLVEGTDPVVFGKLISDTANERVPELKRRGETVTFVLQPVKDIHLQSHLNLEREPPGNPMILVVFSSTGVLILLISCINFINLTSARYVNRAKEVGVRKVSGAGRRQLIGQFMGESFVISFFALAIAIIAVNILLPLLNRLLSVHLEISDLISMASLMGIFIMTIIAGAVAGSYPAILLSSVQPVVALKHAVFHRHRGASARKILVIAQFVISITLIIGSIIIYRQIDFMKYKDPGFEKERKIVLSLPYNGLLTERYETVKEAFQDHPSIVGATVSSTVPGRQFSTNKIWISGHMNDRSMSLKFLRVDHDFIREYDLDVVAGRPFSREFTADKKFGSVIINESLMHAFGWETSEEAMKNTFFDPPRPIVGIVKDFHIRGFQHDLEPLYMNIWPERFRHITLSLETENMRQTLAFIEEKYKEFFPDLPIDYFFLESDFEHQYLTEERINRIFGVFTLLGILISSMGIMGLASYIAEQRTKEIGIRKTLGASVSGLMIFLTKDFGKWVLIASLIAWPIAYVALKQWMTNFAYRVSPGWLTFLLAGALYFVIAVTTAALQVFRTARRNPVESLRYE